MTPKILKGLLLAGCALWTPHAFAQENATSAVSDNGGDIVVTAQRTQSLAGKTPIALTAISGEGLRQAGVTNPVQLADQVPNLSIDRNQGLQITIRGVSSRDQTEKGDPSAAFLSDGIYIARPQAQEVSFYDIDRIEVLRGPQGTLYGKNTTAGVVNVITKRPSDKFEASANLSYGNFDSIQADGMVNVPVSDLLALRFSGSYDRRDSYVIANEGQQGDINPFKNNLSGRAQALFTFSPAVNLLVRGDYSRMKGNDGWAVVAGNGTYYNIDPVNGDPYADPLYIAGGASSKRLRTMGYNLVTPFQADDNTWGISGELNWDFGPVALTYLGSYREFKLRRTNAELVGFDATSPLNEKTSVRSDQTGDYKQNSHEIRLATTGNGPLKAQIGGMYFREDSAVNYIYSNAYGINTYGFLQDPVVNESYGFFGQVTYSITDFLRATAGARYSHDFKKREGFSVYQIAPGDPVLTDTANIASANYEKVTWRTGLEADLDARTLLYATVSTGYKAGGFNDGCAPGTTLNGVACDSTGLATSPDELYYDPETLTSYEIGLKTRTFDNKLRLNLSGFYYDYSNMQLQAQRLIGENLRTIYINAPAKVKGIEADATLAPTRRNSINLAFTWLDAKFDNFVPLGQTTDGALAPVNFKGRSLDRAPRLTVSTGYSYTLPLANSGSLVASVRTRLSSSYVITDFVQARQYRQPSYTRSEASLIYNAPDDRWFVQGFVKNIENDVQVSNLAYSYIPDLYSEELLITPSDPRTYGIRIGFKY